MKHLKKFPINDRFQKLSKDMKKQDHVKPKKDKELDADKSLSDKPRFSKRYKKPSNKKLSSERYLSGKKAVKIDESTTNPDLETGFYQTNEYKEFAGKMEILLQELKDSFYRFCESEGYEDPEGDTDIDNTFEIIKSGIMSEYN